MFISELATWFITKYFLEVGYRYYKKGFPNSLHHSADSNRRHPLLFPPMGWKKGKQQSKIFTYCSSSGWRREKRSPCAAEGDHSWCHGNLRVATILWKFAGFNQVIRFPRSEGDRCIISKYYNPKRLLNITTEVNFSTITGTFFSRHLRKI